MAQTKKVFGKFKLIWLDDKEPEFGSEWLSLMLPIFRRLRLGCMFLGLAELTTSAIVNS
jgi:hypothetical protein